ncbi:MAG TPA: hypothetical protein VHS09_13265, partial [Polyangiaceae bacterium]|nr:hypothetical protein [Polyangiaceae bacterium]
PVASADPGASTEIAPPPPVVSGDPDIPLNEAVVGATPVPADYAAETAPPAPVVEDQPPMPEAGNVWVPGYWWWSTSSHHYVWVSGAWRNPPPDQVWTPGQWVASGAEHYLWVPGFWGAHGAPPPPAIATAPPPPRVEVYGAAPGVGYYWAPGYYQWRDNAYFWSEGSWVRPPREGLGWVEPRYVGIGGHYYFQPGRWDYSAEHRGTVYRPDPNARAGAHITMTPVPQSLVTAHIKFVAQSSHAIANGATRTAGGGYVVRPGQAIFHPGGNEPHPGGNEPHPGGNEPHPGGAGTEPHPGGNEPHPGGAGGAEPHPGGNEPHPGGAGTEPHPIGNEPHPGGNEPHKDLTERQGNPRGLPPEKKPGQK